MKSKLDIYERPYGVYRIAWFLGEDMGSTLGDSPTNEWSEPPPDDKDEWEDWTAHKAVSRDALGDDYGFYWDTLGLASMALRRARAAIKLGQSSRPMPEWATTALAAGWRAPKGWTP